ncbi:S-adenosyl-L-methionine-dependent methyltransferase [Armillaria luteobubalina]|uniref:S-adenosyl-L-methionine-dependent methyltransferase n=1 Tax=Armillaria luteobubalina TaxID=153913 RepID=A0AA39QJB0_9AGAR|nr:S-adenosyl-L-methionine-dependent methyltransferase [Armillaria luteobubalina]
MSKQLLNTSSKHPFSVWGLADKTWNFISESAIRTAWTPLTGLAQIAAMSLMQRVNKGSFRVLTYTGVHTFPHTGPKSPGERTAELRVVNDVFWIRLCAMGDLGFAEAYMYGDVECDDLVSLFHIFLDNRDNLSNLDSKASYLFTLPQKITSYRFLNTISNSRSNISAHYDISNEMFAGFLSQDMTYSCAIFENLDGDLKGGADHRLFSGAEGLQRLSSSDEEQVSTAIIDDHPLTAESDPLYQAQMRKLTHIIKKAKIMPGHRVLEIGSGWCSMAILIAQTIPDTTVDTLTLSVEQQTLAQQRICEAGLQHRISVHLMDYRNMPAEWEAAFDRFISIEMIEAVGKEFLVTYWEQVDWALKKKGAVGVIQVITIPEARFERYMREVDFIRKWSTPVSHDFVRVLIRVLYPVFPGGFLPTLVLLFETLQQGTKGGLTVDSVSNIGPHYARTLREWRRRFLSVFESKIVPALQRQYPDIMTGPKGRSQIEVFKRKWICE